MKRCLLMILATILCPVFVFATDNISNIGSNKNLDAAVTIGDIGTGNAAGVDSNGNLKTTSTSAQTLVRKESSQALTSAALNYTTNFAAKTRIKQIMLHASVAISETVTFKIDSKTGANYDVVLKSEALVAEQDMIYTPSSDLILESGDEINIACTNNNTTGTVYVTVLGETLQ